MRLSYCTNVHPAEDLEGVIRQLDEYSGPARIAAGLDVLGVGLWLPAELAALLASDDDALASLRDALERNRLELRTINAFPFAAFHAEVVKLDVYRPNWADAARLRFTLDCALVLSRLLPPHADGSISTLPLGWRTEWSADDDRIATAQLGELSRELAALRHSSGHAIRLAIEPEPGCILDTVSDIVRWLAPRVADGAIDPEFIGVCLDTCHLAVSFAEPESAVRQIAEAGLRVVKVQASAALEVPDPADPLQRAAVGVFAEKRYLHQVRELQPDGTVLASDDLDEALEALPATGPWRVHFHVPLHHVPAEPLRSTTDVLIRAVAAVAATPGGGDTHLDVETYTWSVLPEGRNPADLVAGIAAELRWAVRELVPPTADAATHPKAQTEGALR
ncbi:metabolite traffic protein EboE [Compostimonas suwonensis]|uniref:Sugar phosphate isomerase/epimerase n=1 Tax=Compostimonas suwonensis TaxID=1048394 RepID=A0A2M9BTZ4_9MICO|nr:metabolite traffic protein EboE [Compostimonas suwonensis]PJJ61428.1 sugar phosphate isomerase/epimerase [Compostimonas suwonensis]